MCKYLVCVCPTRASLVTFTMLRKGSEKKDREVLLDLDHEGSMNSYGSLQNGSSSTPKSVSACFNHSRFKVEPCSKIEPLTGAIRQEEEKEEGAALDCF